MSKSAPTLIKCLGQGDPLLEPLEPKVSQRMTIYSNQSNRNSIDFTNIVIEVTPTVACCIKFGDSTVTAKSGEDFYIPANVTKEYNSSDHVRIAAQGYVSGETGVLFITEKA